jgi:hypothetical protein
MAVVSGSVRSALIALHTAFWNNHHHSPCQDVYDPSRLATILQKQIKDYTNRDPSVKPQKAHAILGNATIITLPRATLEAHSGQMDIQTGYSAIGTDSRDVASPQRSPAAMGRAHLGFGPLEIGTHSIHFTAAMSMFLADVPVYTIMLLGCWSCIPSLHSLPSSTVQQWNICLNDYQ